GGRQRPRALAPVAAAHGARGAAQRRHAGGVGRRAAVVDRGAGRRDARRARRAQRGQRAACRRWAARGRGAAGDGARGRAARHPAAAARLVRSARRVRGGPAGGLRVSDAVTTGRNEDDADAALRRYYAERAPTYEAVYAKPERQADLRSMEAWLPG